MNKSSNRKFDLPRIDTSFNRPLSEKPKGKTEFLGDDYELTSVRVHGQETPREFLPESPELPPMSVRVNLEKEFANVFSNEVNHWGKKYHDPTTGGPGDPEFKRSIDNYVEFRAEIMELKDQGAPPEELAPHFQKLGTMLADAFGMLDPGTNDWSPTVQTAVEQGAWAYAQPSVRSFCITQTPAILRGTASFLATLFAGDHAGVVKHVVNFTYPFAQVPLSIWASQKNGYWQSEAVQLQKRENPTWTPNVVSSKIIEEDGTDGELRLLSDVDEDLEELRQVDQLLKHADMGELQRGLQQLHGRSFVARGELLAMLTRVTKTLGAVQRSGKRAPPSKIEWVLLNDESPLATKMELLSEITSGRAALRVPERQRIKRLLKQVEQWAVLEEELEAAIQKCKAGGTPHSSPALKKMLTETAFERMKVFRYRMLNVVSNQAFVRDIRTCFFMGTTLTQLCGQVAEYITGNELALVTSDEIQAILGVVQAAVYAWQYPKGIAKDALSKLATQWQIIAMTGTGNFIGTDGKVDPKKLDKAVTGPVMMRLSTFASLLQFDKLVYTQALFGWMIDRGTFDNDEAEKVKVRVKFKVTVKETGLREERILEEEVSCTYESLSEEFARLEKPDNREARKEFIKQVAAQRLLSTADMKKVDRILQLYDDNEINLANKTTASKLLGEGSTLPTGTQEILQGSLDFALPASLKIAESIRKANAKLDQELFVRAGKIEQRSELPSQAAQKLGQAFAWVLAGTGGFLFIKSFFALGVEVAILNGDLSEQAADSLAAGILAGKIGGNLLALASTVFSLGLNHAYHEYIATKNLQRQNAAGGPSIVNAPLPSLAGGAWRDFMAFIGVENAQVEEVTGYTTLVGTQIEKDDWPPKLKFVRRSTLTEAMREQMFAANLRSWCAYFDEDQGTLEGRTEADLEDAIARLRAKLRKLLDHEHASPTSAKDRGDVTIDLGASSQDGRIEDLEPPRVPPLDIRALGNSPSRPQSPREQKSDVLTPRTRRRKDKGDRLQKLHVMHSRYTGASKIRKQRAQVDAADIQDLRTEDDVMAPDEDDYTLAATRPIQASAPSRSTGALQWQESRGVHVARQGKVFYVSPDPTRHTNAIPAFSVPDDEGRGLLHIVDRKFPSLAVSNMLQLELGGNRNWETLTSEDEFALFFENHLSDRSQDQSMRIAAMPMEDLATFTQQMTLQKGPAWRPMTTAKVRYVPEAESPQDAIQPAGTPLPLLQRAHAFGVTYEAFDPHSGAVRSSVMLRYDELRDMYSVIDPGSSKPIETPWQEPTEALQWYMEKISSDHADVAKNMIFTVLYHVPAQEPDERLTSARVQLVLEDANAIAFDWLGQSSDVARAQQQMADVCHQLEAENSWRLLRRADEDADQFIGNRAHIAKLHAAHSILASMRMMPPLPQLSDAVLPLVED